MRMREILLEVALKLKGYFDYNEQEIIQQFYTAVTKKENNAALDTFEHVHICSFCGRSKEEAGELALGPGVSICGECLKFGEAVIKSSS
jgi:hypothetical protein